MPPCSSLWSTTQRWTEFAVVPVYAARVEHLTHHETVTALCEVCGHVGEVPVADLLRKFPSFKRIAEIRLWCTRCGKRDRVELDATKALGNDRAL
jgi:hypothetical protein